jgi:hypothetical protein
MKAKKCVYCENATYQKNGVCVLCSIGLPSMYSELVGLVKKEKRIKIQKLKIAATR